MIADNMFAGAAEKSWKSRSDKFGRASKEIGSLDLFFIVL
jgi:hypothetical protein